MRRILSITLGVALLAACGGSGTGADTTSPGSAATTATTAPPSGEGGDELDHPCDTMAVEPADFVTDAYPELEELRREDFDADWLRVDGAVGCLVSLTAPGETFRAVGVEGYVFDAGATSVQDLIDIRLANSLSDITATDIDDLPGAIGLLGENADVPYALAAESNGAGVFVQASGAGLETLIKVATSILDG